jgi:hypothetical protein
MMNDVIEVVTSNPRSERNNSEIYGRLYHADDVRGRELQYYQV